MPFGVSGEGARFARDSPAFWRLVFLDFWNGTRWVVTGTVVIVRGWVADFPITRAYSGITARCGRWVVARCVAFVYSWCKVHILHVKHTLAQDDVMYRGTLPRMST